MKTTEEKLEIALEALDKIASPIGYFMKEAAKDGAKLDGQRAVALANDAEWLKEAADSALQKILLDD